MFSGNAKSESIFVSSYCASLAHRTRPDASFFFWILHHLMSKVQASFFFEERNIHSRCHFQKYTFRRDSPKFICRDIVIIAETASNNRGFSYVADNTSLFLGTNWSGNPRELWCDLWFIKETNTRINTRKVSFKSRCAKGKTVIT